MKNNGGHGSVGERLATALILLIPQGLAFIAAPWLAALSSDPAALLSATHWFLQPVVCAASSLTSARRGISPIICAAVSVIFMFLPIWVFRIAPNGRSIALCAACAVFFSSYGFELRKRGQTKHQTKQTAKKTNKNPYKKPYNNKKANKSNNSNKTGAVKTKNRKAGRAG